MSNKFYGNREVLEIKDVDEKYSVLKFANDEFEEITKKMLPFVLTEESVDLTELRRLRVAPVAEEILKVLLDWDVKTSEVENLFSLVIGSLNENMKSAEALVWGMSSLEKRMSDVDKVLKKNAATNNSPK